MINLSANSFIVSINNLIKGISHFLPMLQCAHMTTSSQLVATTMYFSHTEIEYYYKCVINILVWLAVSLCLVVWDLAIHHGKYPVQKGFVATCKTDRGHVYNDGWILFIVKHMFVEKKAIGMTLMCVGGCVEIQG